MKKNMTGILALIICFTLVSCGEKIINGETKDIINISDWAIKSSTQVAENGEEISNPAFVQKDWISATTPTTVLRALVNKGIYPDPHLAMNNFLIPDASDELNTRLDLGKYSHLPGHPNPFRDPYWFRTSFDLPEEQAGRQVWLNFMGINYRADVWLNGYKIADGKEMVGMFQRFKYNVTEYAKVGTPNYLAVKIHQVDHPGTANPGMQLEIFGTQRGWGVDIFKDVTLKFSAGWDCAPVIRDRNMGIYQDVYLSFTDKIDIRDPYIVTDLPLPDTTIANLTISAELVNIADVVQIGVLKGKIDLINELEFPSYTKILPGKMNSVVFEKKVKIPAGQTLQVTFKPEDFPELVIENPYLWWPNGSGEQYLHNLELTFEIDGIVSDRKNTTFGIREISTTLKEIEGEFGRVFHINGRRIFAKGGWLQPDALLDMNSKRIYDEARFLAEANVNMIANEDMPAPPEELMETYDKYGLMVWETFYQCWRMYPGSETSDNPLDHELALKNSYDIIKRYRNNASLVAWCVACEVTVCSDIYIPLRKYVEDLDSTRPFLATSSIDWDVDKLTPYIKDDLPLGMTDDGAPDYTWYPHPYYFEKVLEVKQQMFRNEMGVPSVPVLSSLKKFMPNLGAEKENEFYPLDKVWAHHGAWDDDGYVYKAYDEALRNRYGTPSSVDDYVRKAQFINGDSYRAMYEAANHRMWDITSGVMLWKLNSCWPTVVWQLYDWFLNPTAAYYYTKKALEPLHIQLNAHDNTVSIINTYPKQQENLTASVKVYDFNLKVKWKKEETFTIGADKYQEIFSVPEIADLTTTYFVKLELGNSDGKTISDNFYWLSSKDDVDLKDLNKLEKVELEISQELEESDGEFLLQVIVNNKTDKLAFFNRLALLKGVDGEEILPTFWEDNFFTLLPGEKKKVKAIVAKADLDGKIPVATINNNM